MKHVLVFLLAIALFSCTKDDIVDNTPKPLVAAEAKTLINASYGAKAIQTMDVYLPANRSDVATKVLILIHGGAWAEGDKSDFNDYVQKFQQLLPGYAIFNLNYSLSNGFSNKFPTQENDIKEAINFIYKNRSNYVISDKWVLAGASAGAHLALLQGYKNSSPVKAKTIVDFFGPTDMEALYNFYVQSDPFIAFGVSQLMSGTPNSNPDMYKNSSPINFVNAQSPPTIILQGGLDDVVPKEQSFALEAKLKDAAVKHELVYYDNQTHGWSDPAILDDSFKKIAAFLNANVP